MKATCEQCDINRRRDGEIREVGKPCDICDGHRYDNLTAVLTDYDLIARPTPEEAK